MSRNIYGEEDVKHQEVCEPEAPKKKWGLGKKIALGALAVPALIGCFPLVSLAAAGVVTYKTLKAVSK